MEKLAKDILDIEDLDNDDVDEGHLLTKENLKGHWWGKKEIVICAKISGRIRLLRKVKI